MQERNYLEYELQHCNTWPFQVLDQSTELAFEAHEEFLVKIGGNYSSKTLQKLTSTVPKIYKYSEKKHRKLKDFKVYCVPFQ